MLAVVIHAASTALLHWLVPGVNPLSEMVSAYLNSEYQWLSRTTFVALACALGFLGTALVLRQTQGAVFWVALVLAAIAVVGLSGVATVPGAARVLAAPSQPAVVLSILLLSLVLRQDAAWQSAGPYLLGISFALIALFVATIVLGTLASAGLGGLANRVVLVLIYLWVILAARGLLVAPAADAAGN